MPDPLDPETRAFALVGRFLHRWSAMESILHDCIQTAFKLTPTMRHIICGNLQLRDKLYILRTVVDVLPLDKRKFDKVLLRVAKRARSRNTIAHEQFQPNENGTGVKFMIVRAKGSYETPNIVWTQKRFEQEYCLLDAVKVQLIELNEELGKTPLGDQVQLPMSVWQPVSDWPVPMRRTFSPALWNFQSHPHLSPLDSDSAIPETSPQTPPKPEE